MIIDGGFVGCTVAIICDVRIVSSVGTKEEESTGDSVTAGMSVESVVIVGVGMIVSDAEKLVSFDNSETEQAVRIAKKLRSRSLVIVGYCMRYPKSWNNIRGIRVSFIFVNKYPQSMRFTKIVFVEVSNGRIPHAAPIHHSNHCFPMRRASASKKALISAQEAEGLVSIGAWFSAMSKSTIACKLISGKLRT